MQRSTPRSTRCSAKPPSPNPHAALHHPAARPRGRPIGAGHGRKRRSAGSSARRRCREGAARARPCDDIVRRFDGCYARTHTRRRLASLRARARRCGRAARRCVDAAVFAARGQHRVSAVDARRHARPHHVRISRTRGTARSPLGIRDGEAAERSADSRGCQLARLLACLRARTHDARDHDRHRPGGAANAGISRAVSVAGVSRRSGAQSDAVRGAMPSLT
jgi:hypothetical protein